MQDLKVDKRIVDAQINNVPEPVQQQQQQQQQQVQLPEEMRFWVAENEWALNPTNRDERKKVQALRKISTELIEDGYSEQDIEFYEELDDRLEKSFGEQGSDGVQLDEDQLEEDTPSSRKTLNTAGKSKKQSPVSGSSRTPSSKKGTVQLTRDEKKIARRLGVTEERYALRKMAMNKSGEESGWTVID
jgi:hypothetical protein